MELNIKSYTDAYIQQFKVFKLILSSHIHVLLNLHQSFQDP